MLRKQNSFQIIIFLITGTLIYMTRDKITLQMLIVIFGGIALVGLSIYNDQKTQEEGASRLVEAKNEANHLVKEATKKMNQLMEAIPSAIVYINQKGEFDVMNRSFREIIAVDAHNVYEPRINSDIRQMLLDAFLNEKQFIRQINYGDVDYQILSIPILESNRYMGCMLIFQDITRVLEGERMQKRFIADASHELKTPITAIKGMSEILNRQEFNDDSTRDEFTAQIQIEASRLEQIVEDLMLQSRLAEKKVYLEKTRFNLKQFFDGLIYERRQELHQNKINVTLSCPSDVMIEADHFRLSQVFLNLFNNAINYAKEKDIKIECKLDSKACRILFSDTGAGMDASIIPYVFERFYRGDEGRDRKNGGSGLGLAISKAIIEEHGGSISVSSEKDKGTCFEIVLYQNDLS